MHSHLKAGDVHRGRATLDGNGIYRSLLGLTAVADGL